MSEQIRCWVVASVSRGLPWLKNYRYIGTYQNELAALRAANDMNYQSVEYTNLGQKFYAFEVDLLPEMLAKLRKWVDTREALPALQFISRNHRFG